VLAQAAAAVVAACWPGVLAGQRGLLGLQLMQA
jgi:hypothetical protein